MKNIVYYNDLSMAIKDAVKKLFSERTPEIISFPFKGRHMRGFFFIWENITYLIIKSEVIRNGNSTLELDMITERAK
ncbi:MAG: hypothetical protein HYZ14_02220 [Bacteroidetes bacterium]|nr:hypothetical protein [Bacteroidota bacterium]